ncbi:MAG: GDSL-type esterase/lipase family protein [Candidatus Omnitrophota bacterium]
MILEEGVELYNVAELIEENGSGRLFSRIPNRLRLSLNESARIQALTLAGSEIRFNLNGAKATIVLKTEGEGWGIAEVFQGPFQVGWHYITSQPTEITVSLPDNLETLEKANKKDGYLFDPRLTRIVLPHLVPVRLIDINVRDGSIVPPRAGQTPSQRYLAYGSSITHGASAVRPTGTYAKRTAELLGVDLISLGFGGGAHGESQMADYIAGRKDWDFASLELGINMVGSFEVAEFRDRVVYFINRISEAYPEKWLFCIDLFTFYADLDEGSKTQKFFRKVVREAVKKVNNPKVVHIDGRKILPGFSGLCVDLVHPSSSGMEQMALNLSRFITRKMRY